MPEGIDETKISIQSHTDDDGKVVYYVCAVGDNQEIEQTLEKQGFVRDEDVLDTWFSSALWPLIPTATPCTAVRFRVEPPYFYQNVI